MVESNLTEAMRSELARLALLPDEEIDTSDAPEVEDWSDARRAAFYDGEISKRDYDIRAIANWVLNRLGKIGHSASNLSLNKILYFAVERALVERAVLLTPARIEAWDHGPVFREVYQEFSRNDNKTITQRIEKFSIRERKMIEASEEFLPEDIELLEYVVNQYGHLSGSKLREISHTPNGPWHTVWNYRGKTNPGMEISATTILRRAPQRRDLDG